MNPSYESEPLLSKRKYPGVRVRKGKHGLSYQVRTKGPDGEERVETFSRISDARDYQALQKADIRRGLWTDPRLGKIKFEAWVEEWWRTSTHHLKPVTREGYRSLLSCHLLPEFGSIALTGISTSQVKTWVAALAAELSPSRTRQAYRLLKMIISASVESGYIARNPCLGVKLPRLPDREMRILNPDQIQGLAAAAGDYSVLVMILAYGGLRWSEAVGLRRKRCDLVRSRIEIAEAAVEVNGHLHFGPPKTYAHRATRLPRFASDLLAKHLAAKVKAEPEALVFTSPGGSPLRRSNFSRRLWKPALQATGLPEMRVHDLRHSCASLLIREGASIKAVQEQLGHSSPSVTLDVYSHLFDDDLDRLYEKLDASHHAAGVASLGS